MGQAPSTEPPRWEEYSVATPIPRPHQAVPALEFSKYGAKESFRGHMSSDTLGKTLATAPPSGAFFCVARPSAPAPLVLPPTVTNHVTL